MGVSALGWGGGRREGGREGRRGGDGVGWGVGRDVCEGRGGRADICDVVVGREGGREGGRTRRWNRGFSFYFLAVVVVVTHEMAINFDITLISFQASFFGVKREREGHIQKKLLLVPPTYPPTTPQVQALFSLPFVSHIFIYIHTCTNARTRTRFETKIKVGQDIPTAATIKKKCSISPSLLLSHLLPGW